MSQGGSCARSHETQRPRSDEIWCPRCYEIPHQLAGLPLPPSATRQLTKTFLPRWAPNTSYVSGDKVLSPTGDVVSAVATSVSGASYVEASWKLSSSYGKLVSDNVWTGNATFSDNIAARGRQPFMSSQEIQPSDPGLDDHIGHAFQTKVYVD